MTVARYIRSSSFCRRNILTSRQSSPKLAPHALDSSISGTMGLTVVESRIETPYLTRNDLKNQWQVADAELSSQFIGICG